LSGSRIKKEVKMGVALFLIGILAIIAGIVMFILALVKKSGWGVVRSLAIGGVGLILAIVGVVVGVTQEAPESVSPTISPPSETPPPSEVGKSRLNPVPFGSSLTYEEKRLTVISSNRLKEIGWSSADVGSVYLVVNVKVDFLGNPSEKMNYLSTFVFRVVGSKGKIYDAAFFPETDNPLKGGEFYGGTTTSGDLVYEIDEQDTNLVLIWNCSVGVDRYLEIP
jgi:hypothetical protein